jgi:hypothetical protein
VPVIDEVEADLDPLALVDDEPLPTTTIIVPCIVVGWIWQK